MYDFPNQSIDFSPDRIINLNIDSIGPAIGTIIIGIFFIYTLVYYIYTHGEAVTKSFITLQLSLFLFLLGHTMSTSSSTLWEIDFWTRVRYVGISIAPIFSISFISSVIKRPFTKVKLLAIFNCLVCIAFIWLDDKLILTHSLISMSSYHGMVKGPAFDLLVGYILVSLMICYVLFIRYFIKNPDCRSLYWPLAAGLTAWMAVGFYGALGAAGILNFIDFTWSGPVIMMLMFAIFQGKLLSSRTKELENVVKEKDTLYEQMIHDDLTGILSRNYLIHTLKWQLDTLSLTSQEHCLLFIDLDNFKLVNDRLGHQGGDLLLKLVGKILIETCRKSDIPSRFGGDEFLVFLNDCTEEQAIGISKRIQERYVKEFYCTISNLIDISPGLSIGISSSLYWNNVISEVIEQPDFAMYEAKRAGKNKIGVYTGCKREYIEASGLSSPVIKLVQ